MAGSLRMRRRVMAQMMVCVSIGALSAGAHAQVTPVTDSQSAQILDDIVVTARKRAERLQDVPVVVSAFTPEAIANKGATDLQALSTSIPNVKLEHVGLFQTAASFSMRGLGNTSIESFDDPRVAVYIDGAYQPRTADGLGDMFDVETVEVLRGPQGALYGRNAFAGAVAVRSKRPGFDFEGEAEATIANYGRRDLKAAVNIPLVEDKVAARFAYMHREFDGFFRVGNESPSLSVDQQSELVGRELSHLIGERTGGDRRDSFRGLLRFTPTDDVDINLIVKRVEVRADGSPTINQTLAGSRFAALGFPGRNPFGDHGRGIDGDGSNPFLSGANYGNRTDIDEWDITADSTVSLWGGEWYTVVNFKKNDSLVLTDTDGTLVDLFSSERLEEFESFQAETRYQRSFLDDRMDVLGGVFYLRDKFQMFQRLLLGFGAPGNPAANPPVPETPRFRFPTDGRSPSHNLQFLGQVRKTISPYFQVNYDLTDEVRLNAALRYSWEKRTAFDFPGQAPLGPSGSAALSRDFDQLKQAVVLGTGCGEFDDSTDSWSPSLGIDYKPTPDVMLFASWQRAFKSGGINAKAATCQTFSVPYADEQIDNFEVGLKSDLADGHLRFNVNFFWSELKNLQVTAIRANPLSLASTESIVANAAGARIRGIEAEIVWVPIEGLNLFLNGGYLDSKYKDFCANLTGAETFTGAPPTSSCGSVTVLQPGVAIVERDNGHLSLPYAPKWDGQVGVRYSFDVGTAGSLNLETSVNYTSAQETNLLNYDFSDRKPMTTWDASIGFLDMNERFRVMVWGRNLTNSVGRLFTQVVNPNFTFAFPTEPRTYGVTLSASF